MATEESESPSYDKGLIQLAIGKNSEVQLVKQIKLELKGGDKIETRILVVTSFRYFILASNSKGPYKVELSVHILDVHAIESKKPEQVVIQYGEKQTKFCLTKPGSANNVIGQLIANTKINFPGGNLYESLRKDIEPGDKLEAINNIVNKLTSSDSLTEAGPCGGFSRSYACICNHYGMPFLEEVAWDIDTIYLSHDTKEFNLQDFDHLEPRELIPIITTLEYNAWFTKLVCVSYKLPSEILDIIAKVMKRSTTIQELVLDGVVLGREFCQKLATALTSNPKSALERIDLSNNPSAEDRGITHLVGSFSKLSHGLDSMNLHDTGITSKGASTIGHMLKNSKYMSTSLTRLNLSNNMLKVDGVTVICDFLAHANSLTHLDLSGTECTVEQIFGALLRGCCQNLSYLSLSGNSFTNRKSKDTNLPASFQQFFSSSAALQEIKMSECRLPADAARAMFLGLTENHIVKAVDIDISKNELKAAGLRAITGPLSQISNLRSLDLCDNGFESDVIPLCESLCQNRSLKKLYLGQNCNKGRNLNNIMEAIIKLISTENSPIELLSLADSRLKQSINPLFDALGTNESLIELDISGNMMGDDGARVLAKALQINNKLRTIHWDRNGVTQHGLRDIALALENNLTLQCMPIPITDVTLCLKPATEKALKQIEKCLSRNHSPSQAVTEQAYRLQQGLMMSSTQQQMVDKLIVQLQDTARVLRSSSDKTVKSGLRNALRCINDADKLKQLFLKFHMCTGTKKMEEQISSVAADIHNLIQQQMKDNVEKILDCAASNCPFVTEEESVKESLKVACEGKANVSKAFIDTAVVQQLSPIILNEVSEKTLNISTIVADTMMDKVISQLEEHQAKLDLLLKEHQKSPDEKPVETEESEETISEAAQKAKNRLSAAQNRRSMLFPDNENDVFSSPTHHKRRPTISRKRKTSDVDDRVDSGHEETKKKESLVVGDVDLSVPAAATKELVHHTKNRARPARGRRPPTRPSAQQNAPAGPEIVVDSVDDGLDSFFTKQATRPQSAIVSSNAGRDAPLPKSASVSQRPHPPGKKKNDKEEVEENQKEPQEKKKHGILGSLGLFKKKSDKKSPTAPRKNSKNKDHRKSMEDLVDGGPSEATRDRKSSEPKPKPVKELHPKPAAEETAKPLPVKPVPKVEVAASDEQKKPPKNEIKLPPKSNEQRKETKEVELTEEKKEKEVDKVHEKDNEKDEETKESEKEEEKETEGVTEGNVEETTEAETNSAVSAETVSAKPQPKAPPKFGIGLPMAGVGGDLLAEMKKRQEKNSGNKSTSPEQKTRARVSTNPDIQRPVVPVRPSSMKRSDKAKSASDLLSPAELDSKPVPRPRSREVKPNDNSKEVAKKNQSKEGDTRKPVPPKPAPKEKPSVAARPTVPKRPASIARGRGNSQKDTKEQRKSAEVEKPVTEKTREKETPEPEAAQEKGGEKALSEKPQEKQPAENVPDKPQSEKEPEKAPVDKEPETSPAEKEFEKPSAQEKSAAETGTEKPTDQRTEEKDVSMVTPEETVSASKSTEEKQRVEEQPEEGEKSEPKTDVENGKEKDSNDNVSDKNAVSASTEEAAPSEDVTSNDDVVKSPVDVDALTEAIESSKDTSL